MHAWRRTRMTGCQGERVSGDSGTVTTLPAALDVSGSSLRLVPTPAVAGVEISGPGLGPSDQVWRGVPTDPPSEVDLTVLANRATSTGCGRFLLERRGRGSRRTDGGAHRAGPVAQPDVVWSLRRRRHCSDGDTTTRWSGFTQTVLPHVLSRRLSHGTSPFTISYTARFA